MKVSRFDVLHHRIIISSRDKQDTTHMRSELDKILNDALDNNCPEAECFIKRLEARQPLVLRKNNSKIVKFLINFINKLEGK